MNTERRTIIRIGLLALLVMSLVGLMVLLFGNPSPHASNARTLAQLQQYMNALELIRLEKGTYPITEGLVCLGDYNDNQCWDKEGRGVVEDRHMNDMLDTYVPILPAGPLISDTANPENGREGYVYRSERNGRSYEIQYMLTGKRTSCGFGEELALQVVKSKESAHTLCTLTR
jgi:hypothetical protein